MILTLLFTPVHKDKQLHIGKNSTEKFQYFFFRKVQVTDLFTNAWLGLNQISFQLRFKVH